MPLRWREIVVIPEVEEGTTCDCCGRSALSAEGRLVHCEEPISRFTIRWRPGDPDHAARHVLYLGNWNRRGSGPDGPAVAVADYRGGADHGFVLRDDAASLLQALKPWRPRYIRRHEAIGQPLGEAIFAMLTAIHRKDPRLEEVRRWAAPSEAPPGAAAE